MNGRLPARHLVTAAAFTSAALLAAGAHALPSFPGAEGFGAIATGGRGGRVIKVTTLDATGPGSLQEALSAEGPRIVVFAVSGVIEGDITVEHGDVTIAGQTAPGAGITIHGQFFGAYDESVGNIVVRHLRVRPTYDGSDGEQFDAVQFSRNHTLILDHLSVSWGVDETIDLYEADDVTVQWTTVEESGTEGHPEGMHNYGLINGPDGHRIALHHTLFAHHRARCPAIANGPAEVRNNVAYNVRHGFVHHNPPSGPFDIVGNVFIQGPNDSLIPFYFDDEGEGPGPDLGYFLADNYIDDPGEYVGVVDNPWQSPPLHPSFADLVADESLRSESEYDFAAMVESYAPVNTQRCDEALGLVLDKAGAWPRDAVTLRTIHEVETRSGEWGAHEPGDLLEGLSPAEPPQDADDDGMADAWESEHGLDPTDPTDNVTVTASGYTAIEDYINELADELTGGPPPGGDTNPGTDSTDEDDPLGTDDPAHGYPGWTHSGCACRTTAVPVETSGRIFETAPLVAMLLAYRRRRSRRLFR